LSTLFILDIYGSSCSRNRNSVNIRQA